MATRATVLSVVAVVVALAFAAPTAARLSVLGLDNKDVIHGDYIVLFHSNSTQVQREQHLAMVTAQDEASEATTLRWTYDFEDFFGYAGTLEPSLLERVLDDEAVVAHVEADQLMHASLSVQRAKATCSMQTFATWGLVRVNEGDLNIDGDFAHKTAWGQDVNVYVIDTGIYLENEAFGGRAVWGTDTVDDPSPMTDNNGHGTHVAGTCVADMFGIARGATAIAVKVLGANGSGTNSGVIAGVEWAAEHKKQSGKRGVANMSLGGGYSLLLNMAVNAAVKGGLPMAVAAGNEDQDASLVSPASASQVVTVGATTNEDERSWFSNWGTAVDIMAPGSDITSTWLGKDATNTISGTSMASPHVAGVMAAILSQQDLSPTELTAHLRDSATEGKITDLKDSPNLLLNLGCP